MARRKKQGKGRVRSFNMRKSDNGGFIVDVDRVDSRGMFLKSENLTFASFEEATSVMKERMDAEREEEAQEKATA